MSPIKKFALLVVAITVAGVFLAGAARAAATTAGEVSATEIQGSIDRQLNQADADRAAIGIMLQRPEVQRLAGLAGLDVARATAAASVLSGESLQQLGAQARLVNNDLAGGDNLVIPATTVIIVLLVIILLAA